MLYRKEDKYDFSGNFRMSSLNEISKAEKRLANKKLQLEDVQNELDLIERQTFETYKNNITYLIIGQKGVIDKAKKWLKMLKDDKDNDGNKLDKRKKYEEKTMYEYYIGVIEGLLKIKMEDVHFIDYNFGQSTEIEFTYLDHKWSLSIPHIEKLNLKIFHDYGHRIFQLSLSHNDKQSSCSWTLVGYTYDEEELSGLFEEGVKKYCGEGEV